MVAIPSQIGTVTVRPRIRFDIHIKIVIRVKNPAKPIPAGTACDITISVLLTSIITVCDKSERLWVEKYESGNSFSLFARSILNWVLSW